MNSEKDFVLQLIPTPEEEEGVPTVHIKQLSGSTNDSGKAKKPPSGRQKGPSCAVRVDNEWVTEHACQLARILPGGLSVLGIYLYCKSEEFKSFQTSCISLLHDINREVNVVKSHGKANVVVHVDAVKAVMSAREMDGGNTLKPCELKNSSLLTDMIEIQCSYPLDVQLDITNDGQILNECIQDVISWEIDHRVKPSVPLLMGKVPSNQQQIYDVMKHEGFSHVPFELLVPFETCGPMSLPDGIKAETRDSMCGGYQSRGKINLSGLIECRAYVYKREQITAALEAIKEDVELSLRARLEILVEAAEMATEAMEEENSSQNLRNKSNGETRKSRKHPMLETAGNIGSYTPHMPRRAFLKWRQGPCSYCDYVVEGDGVTEALHRMKEIVGPGKVDATTFQCKEEAPRGIRSTLSVGPKKRSHQGRAFSTCSIMLVGAAGAAALAVAASFAL